MLFKLCEKCNIIDVYLGNLIMTQYTQKYLKKIIFMQTVPKKLFQ